MSWKRKLLWSVVGTVLLLPIVVEVGLGFVMLDCWPSYFLPRHYPGVRVQTYCGEVSAEWTTNALGFHDVDHPRQKPAGEYRVVCIGDSFLAGPQARPMPWRLRDVLREADPRFNVINLSRPVLQPHHYYLMMREIAFDLSPDLVVVFIYEGNDFMSMGGLRPERYERPTRLFARFPDASWLGSWFPRTSILIADLPRGGMLRRGNPPEEVWNWGKVPRPAGSLRGVAGLLGLLIDRPVREIEAHLQGALSRQEVTSLVSHRVRLDALAYVVGLGMGAPFKRKMPGARREEIENPALLAEQVDSVFAFLLAMRDRCRERGVSFTAALIPTSHADPNCRDLFRRLGAESTPLFAKTRTSQTDPLRRRLRAAGVKIIDLIDSLEGQADTYLKFDTHWTEKGAGVAAEIVAEAILRH